MKLIHSTIIVSLLMLVVALPSQAGAVVCQNKTAIVYGNGIYNTKRMATDSLFVGLKNRLIQSSAAYADQTKYEFKLAYADNGGATGIKSPNGLQKLHGAYTQRNASNDTMFWRRLGGIAIAPTWFKNMMNTIAASLNAQAYVNNTSLQLQLNGDPANQTLQPGYRTLLKQGKRIVIVAHSQGNFYANAASDALTFQAPAVASNIGIVAVATPDWRVGGGGPHITVPEDAVIEATRVLYPNTLAVAPVGQFVSANMTELTRLTRPVSGFWKIVGAGIDVWRKATYGHSFVDWYLAGTYTRDFILKGIVNTINGRNGVGGLQYPTQGCSVTPPPPIPQPGPFYYRDDWGEFTYNFDWIGSLIFSPSGTFDRSKNLRDDYKGLAYHVKSAGNIPRSPLLARLMWKDSVSINITDYINQEQGTISHTFSPWNGSSAIPFAPDDVLLTKNGLIFLAYSTIIYNHNHFYGSKTQVVEWRKLNTRDNGIGAVPRWSVLSEQAGQFVLPKYDDLVRVGRLGGTWHYEIQPNVTSGWFKQSVAYRFNNSYEYKVPFMAGFGFQVDCPKGPFGWVNGVYVNPKFCPVSTTHQWEYGVLDVNDGLISFQKSGKVMISTAYGGGVQIGNMPKIASFSGIETTMAYKRMQSFLADAAAVNEAGSINIGSTFDVSPPNGGLFFRPADFPRRLSAGIYGQIFLPFSLSDKMAMTYATPIINHTPLSQTRNRYKLSDVGRVAANDPILQQLIPPITLPNIGRATNQVIMSIEQKSYLESP